jgi:AcrR family transcriptional regulator
MSKTTQATRALVLERARELFNARGIDNVGVRDLARELGLSPGNLSYWFPRKEDLVRALLDELAERNARRHSPSGPPDLDGLLLGFEAALRSQLDYRCLTESIVHVTRTWPELAERYRLVEHTRRAQLTDALRRLASEGVLRDLCAADDQARVVGTWSLIARFWMSEARLSYAEHDDDTIVRHYVALAAHALRPYAPDDAAVARRLVGVLPSSLGPARPAAR